MVSAKAIALVLASQGASGTLTLDDAIRIAELNAFSVRTAFSQVEKERQRHRELRGNLGPKLGAQGVYQRFGEAQQQFGGPGGGTQEINESRTAGASLQMPIDITGTLKSVVDAQLNNVKSQEYNLLATRSGLRNTVRRAYYDVLRAQNSEKVAQVALEAAQEQLRVTQANVAAGTAAKVDELRVEAQVKQFENNLLVAKNAVVLSKANLNNTLARSVDTEFETQPVVGQALPSVEEREAKQAALKFRPELSALRYAQKALKGVTRSQEGGLLPGLSFGINYQHTFEPRGPFTPANQTVGQITLSLPIFDSGITRAKVRQAREDEEQAKIRYEQTELGIALQVRQAIRNLATASDRLRVSEAQVQAAEEALRLSQLRDKAGEGIVLEVLDAQQNLANARNALVNAQYDLYLAYADLQLAIGRDEVSEALTQAKGES